MGFGWLVSLTGARACTVQDKSLLVRFSPRSRIGNFVGSHICAGGCLPLPEYNQQICKSFNSGLSPCLVEFERGAAFHDVEEVRGRAMRAHDTGWHGVEALPRACARRASARACARGSTADPSSFVAGELSGQGTGLGTMRDSGWQRPWPQRSGCVA